MKKLWIYIFGIALIIAIVAVSVFYFNKSINSNKSTTNYNAEKTNTSNTINQNSVNYIESNVIDNSSNTNDSSSSLDNSISVSDSNQPLEEEIASFSTKIYNPDSERQNNITITCSTLNNTEVPAGSTFSFCDTVGKATADKGYKEADIIVNGKKEQGLGGGNCQVSTTLYNAVLAVPNLQVTERHEHSGHVPYVAEGKDAAVSYGTYDFKFVNNTGSTIKILAQNSADAVTIKLIKETTK